jgi:hypothetical protein
MAKKPPKPKVVRLGADDARSPCVGAQLRFRIEPDDAALERAGRIWAELLFERATEPSFELCGKVAALGLIPKTSDAEILDDLEAFIHDLHAVIPVAIYMGEAPPLDVELAAHPAIVRGVAAWKPAPPVPALPKAGIVKTVLQLLGKREKHYGASIEHLRELAALLGDPDPGTRSAAIEELAVALSVAEAVARGDESDGPLDRAPPDR